MAGARPDEYTFNARTYLSLLSLCLRSYYSSERQESRELRRTLDHLNKTFNLVFRFKSMSSVRAGERRRQEGELISLTAAHLHFLTSGSTFWTKWGETRFTTAVRGLKRKWSWSFTVLVALDDLRNHSPCISILQSLHSEGSNQNLTVIIIIYMLGLPLLC